MRKLSIFLFLFLPSLVWGQKVSLPEEVIPYEGDPAVSIAAITDCESIQWYVLDPGLRLEKKDNKTVTVILPEKQGRYRILAYGAKGGLASSPAVCTVVVGSGVKPPIDPPVDPPVDPIPSPKRLFVVVIEETSEGAKSRAQLLGSKELEVYFRTKGHKWRIVDKDVRGPDGQPPADIARFLEMSRGKAYPQMYLVDQQGKTVYAGNLPSTPAELVKIMQKVGG